MFLLLFFSALDEHTDMLELDCHITRDGEVVVSHDNNLKRICGSDLLITETDHRVGLMMVYTQV